jgi:hypothetical protein
VGLEVAANVGHAAIAEGVSGLADPAAFADELREYVWEPVYLPYERVE